MKNLIFTALLFAGINMRVAAQFSQGAQDTAQIEIQQLTNEWNRAIEHRDSLILEKIVAPEYSLNGMVNRSTWMNNTLHHISTDTLAVVGIPSITYYGLLAKSEAVLFWKASYDGMPVVNGEFLITDIWTKQNGHWQVMLRMSLP